MYTNIIDNIDFINNKFSNSSDLTLRRMIFPNKAKTKFAVYTLEGMVDSADVASLILNPIFNFTNKEEYEKLDGKQLFDFVYGHILSGSDISGSTDFEPLLHKLMSGFALVLFDGVETGLCVGVQGYKYRSVDEPNNESSQRGSREGFIEPIKPNMGLLRRRLKTTDLVFESMAIGSEVKTNIVICYRKSKVSNDILDTLRNRLKKCNLRNLLGSGYLVTYLEDNRSNKLFSGVGVTERPDTAAGKINEGRIAIIVDGSPAVLIVPRLFIENFQSFDDYTNRPYYSGFVRILKYLSFVIAILLPAIFVAVLAYYPQLIPLQLLGNIISSIRRTPLPVMIEVILMYFIYEITREAGLRSPRLLTQTVGIVGGLVIGDAAVGAGIIGAPTLLIVAMSAVCSIAVPDLYSPCTILRLVFILLGGIFGIWGIAIGFFVLIVELCSKTSFGIAFLSPIAPFSAKGMKDVFIRANWRNLSDGPIKVQDFLQGAENE